MKLDVGCGDQCRRGHVGVDPYHPSAPVHAPAWDLPYASGAVDEVYTSHALEHMTKVDVGRALAEFSRVLRSGGRLDVRVPDLAYACRRFIEAPDEPWSHVLIFGQHRYQGDEHRSGWTVEQLSRAIELAGFVIESARVEWSALHRQDQIIVEAMKP